MAEERLRFLFERFRSRTYTAEEKKELAMLCLLPENQLLLQELLQTAWEQTSLAADMPEEKAAIILARILETVTIEKTPVPGINWYKRIAVAASILVAVATASYFGFFNKKDRHPELVSGPFSKDVPAPTSTKATITLADGRIISIDSINTLTQGEVTITKDEEGRVVYASTVNGQQTTVVYNTLSNPRGSKVIDLALVDGSHVWLNAGSSITYPVAFINNERKVSIDGEAYFEIAKDASKKFIVSKGTMNVEVLGTHFNVNAYDDEQDIKVTLLEGSVEVKNQQSKIKIKPGQQAVLTHDARLTAQSSVDLDAVIAWKNGKFQFGEGAGIQEIMREIARWYDVEVQYRGKITGHIGGSISRNVNASQVFKMLEMTGVVKFEIEGKKIIVSQ